MIVAKRAAPVTDSAPEFTPAATVAAMGKFLADGDLLAAWRLMVTCYPPTRYPRSYGPR